MTSYDSGNLNSFITKDTVKMVRLGQQCMERVSAVVNQIGKKYK